MAKTKISEISEGGIPLGENKFKEGQKLDAAMFAGHLVKFTSSGIALGNTADGDYGGILKEHEGFDLDTEITISLYGTVVTEGYCAAKIVNPATTKYPGTLLYGVVGTPGFLTIVAVGSPIAVLERTILTGDEVAIVKLLR